jgi:hypothetical protein
MSKIIRFSNNKPPQKIRDTGLRAEKLAAEAVADALQAEAVASSDLHGSALTVYSLRDAIYRRLTSTGGRPALAGSVRRQKIPLSDQDWDELKRIAENELGSKAISPAQVGAMLIRLGLAQIRKSGVSSLDTIS